MYRTRLAVTVFAAFPLLLAACGSSSTAKTGSSNLSPRLAVKTAYHSAGTKPESFHVNEVVSVTVDGKAYANSVVAGNVYSDPANTSGSYASLTEQLSTLSKSEGSLSMLLKNDTLYVDASHIHGSGISVSPGWKAISLSNYSSGIKQMASTSIVPTMIENGQPSLLKAALNGAKVTTGGSATVAGQPVNVYTVSTTYTNLVKAMFKSKGELATSLAKVISLYHMNGTAIVTVDIAKHSDHLAAVGIVMKSTFAPVKGSSVKYNFDISIQQTNSNYGVKFSVSAPATTKTVTNFSDM